MYINAIIPQYLPFELTYNVPILLQDSICCGVRIELSIGKQKIISGIVSHILSDVEVAQFEEKMRGKESKIKDVISVTSQIPLVTDNQLKLWKWIASYYMCTEGEVMKYFFPNELIIKGVKTEDGIDYNKSRSQITEKVISLHAKYSNEIDINELLDSLKRSKRQLALLLYFLEIRELDSRITIGILEKGGFNSTHIRKAIKDEIFEVKEEVVVKSFDSKSETNLYIDENDSESSHGENDSQYDEIEERLNLPLVLHSSNREENIDIYIKLVVERFNRGESSLILVAEDEKEDNLVDCLKSYFNKNLITYFSRDSQNKRYKNYCTILNGETKVIIGNKLALGLPLDNISLIIVTDEHSRSYKSEKSPRIQGRDVALVVSKFNSSSIILESYAPSVESYYNSKIGKYNFLSTAKKSKCKITAINKYSIARKERNVYGNIPEVRYFSKFLLDKMENSVVNNDTTLLFHNRRGYNSFLECKDCGEVLKCNNCNVSMTYHNDKQAFVCHYCGYKVEPISKCVKCDSPNLQYRGIGSENIEQSIKKHFPLASTLRLDSDNLSNIESINVAKRILENREANIIVGTWLTIPFTANSNISLIGVIDADTLFNVPDFRAEERAYQLLTQLSQRVGDGEMVVQCTNISSPIMNDIISGDYISMCNRELTARHQFSYPPFVRSTKITIQDKSEDSAYAEAERLIAEIREGSNVMIVGPEIPMVDKVRGLYIVTIMVKFSKSVNSEIIKGKIYSIVNSSKFQTTIDVDNN